MPNMQYHHISAANAEEHTIQPPEVAAEETSKTQIGRRFSVVGVLAGVLAVAMLGAAPMLLATGTHLRNADKEPHTLEKIVVDAAMQKVSVPLGSLLDEDCRQTRSCAHWGHRCYKKNEHWAGCRASCTPGIHPHDPPEHRTPWSCVLLPDYRSKYIRNNGQFPEWQVAVSLGNMRGLCLTKDGKDVRYMTCGRTSTKWITRDHFGDFDLWLRAGPSGLSISPQGCGKSEVQGPGSPASLEYNCGYFGLKRNKHMIELTEDGVGAGLCLSTATGEMGSLAIWKPCSKYSLQFNLVDYEQFARLL